MLGEFRAERGDVLLHQRAVLIGERLGHDRNLLAALEVLEARRIVVPELNLRWIEHVEHHQVVPEKPQRLDRLEDDVGLLVKIRDEREHAAPLEVLRHLPDRPAQVAGAFRLRPIQRVQDDVEMLGRHRHVTDDVLVERDEAHAVALAVRQIGEARRQIARIFQLGDPAAGEPHGL